jgi:hypothetical protein
MATTVLSEFKLGDKVIAAIAMKGIPAGTHGQVIHTQGLTWARYWVRFDNGQRMGTIDRSKLATAAEWDRKLNGTEEVALVVAGGSAVASAIAEGAVGAVLESVNGVPGHLIERSRVARERLAAKKG